MTFTTDDLCLSYLKNFKYFDKIKEEVPEFKMIAFAIGNFNNDELLLESPVFKTWFEEHRDWVEIGVHSYDHEYPPDGDRDNEGSCIEKAIRSLMPFLGKDWIYRSPGWQTTNKTVPTLKKLGFKYIAYETKVNDIQEEKTVETQVFNSHLYDINSIRRIHEILQNQTPLHPRPRITISTKL